MIHDKGSDMIWGEQNKNGKCAYWKGELFAQEEEVDTHTHTYFWIA